MHAVIHQDGVVVEHHDPFCPARQRPLDAEIISAGIPEVRLCLQVCNCWEAPAQPFAAAICGRVIHKQNVELRTALHGKGIEACCRIALAVPVEDDHDHAR
jgi:hypothetical protein